MIPANQDDRRYVRVRTQLRDAVKSLAAAKPAETIRVAELTQVAGVSRAVFYHHATTPAGLLADDLIDDLRPAFEAFGEGLATPGVNYVSIWREVYLSLLDHVGRHGAIYRVLSTQESSVSSALESFFEQTARTFVTAITSHLTDETPSALWTEMAVAQTARDMTAVIRAWVRTDFAASPETVVDTYLTLAPPWQLARADATGRISLRRGRSRRSPSPPNLDHFQI